MFRMSKDFNARVYDEVRKHALLEDSGSHLVALALLKPTIDKMSQKNNNGETNNNMVNFREAVSRGMRILESATDSQKEFASLTLLSIIHQYKERHNESYKSSGSNKQKSLQTLSAQHRRRQRTNNNAGVSSTSSFGDDNNDSSEGSLQALLNAEASGALDGHTMLESSEEAALSEEVQQEFVKMMEFVVEDLDKLSTTSSTTSGGDNNSSQLLMFKNREADEGLESLVDAL